MYTYLQQKKTLLLRKKKVYMYYMKQFLDIYMNMNMFALLDMDPGVNLVLVPSPPKKLRSILIQ